MPSNPESGNLKAAVIHGTAIVVAALIGVGGTIFVASKTGRLTTPSDTRELQKDREENTRLKRENSGLQQENASLRDEIAQCKTPSATPSSPPNESSAQVEAVGNFVSRLDGCEKSAGAVTCAVRVTNTKQDRLVRLYNDRVSMIDSAGNEQKPSVVRFGASTNMIPAWFAQTILPTNIPVKVSVRFEGVEPDVSGLARLALGFEWGPITGDTDKVQIEFRNIPLH
jgi:hypothetical protein